MALTMEIYEEKHGNTIGLRQYDITKFTRAERAKAWFNGKDLLADWPVKDPRQDLLDMV